MNSGEQGRDLEMQAEPLMADVFQYSLQDSRAASAIDRLLAKKQVSQEVFRPSRSRSSVSSTPRTVDSGQPHEQATWSPENNTWTDLNAMDMTDWLPSDIDMDFDFLDPMLDIPAEAA